ncbi:hypothetical protein GCM10010266_49270 [Streptomyces griseomycini]|uniref:hypothetical protein n=1 Tax=Streptomyces griseomycini TaxID=66895 RepID=UPI00187572AE|nr:hypothetical protein [Streptomyces griseomycini]GGQ20338.1 hypothetical protein GCM10010266_49270 [Streptomyces griseomycini]
MTSFSAAHSRHQGGTSAARRALPVTAAALTATAALLLSACGGDGDEPSDDTEGAGTGVWQTVPTASKKRDGCS